MTEKKPPPSRLKTVRRLLWVLVALSAIGVAMLLLRGRAGVDSPEPRKAAAVSAIGGPFTLVGGDGRPFSSSRLEGKPYAIFFGFTNCPDVCPTTLARLVKLRRQAGGADQLNIVFVTIDPERDGPGEVAQYATLFGAPVIALTGSPQQIDAVKKQFGIYAEKAPATGAGHDGNHSADASNYMMSHSSTVLLFDRDGQFVATIATDEGEQAALDKIKRVTA